MSDRDVSEVWSTIAYINMMSDYDAEAEVECFELIRKAAIKYIINLPTNNAWVEPIA